MITEMIKSLFTQEPTKRSRNKNTWKRIRNPPGWVYQQAHGMPGTYYIKGRTFKYKIVIPFEDRMSQGPVSGEPIFYRKLLGSKQHKSRDSNKKVKIDQ